MGWLTYSPPSLFVSPLSLSIAYDRLRPIIVHKHLQSVGWRPKYRAVIRQILRSSRVCHSVSGARGVDRLIFFGDIIRCMFVVSTSEKPVFVYNFIGQDHVIRIQGDNSEQSLSIHIGKTTPFISHGHSIHRSCVDQYIGLFLYWGGIQKRGQCIGLDPVQWSSLPRG